MGHSITGVIRDVDLGRRVLTLTDGTELWMPPEASMGGLSGNLPVKATYALEGECRRVLTIRSDNVPI